jgi:hypothetical protein
LGSLDHLVGEGEDRLRHGQVERLGGLEIDDQLESGRLLDRQIGRRVTTTLREVLSDCPSATLKKEARLFVSRSSESRLSVA